MIVQGSMYYSVPTLFPQSIGVHTKNCRSVACDTQGPYLRKFSIAVDQ